MIRAPRKSAYGRTTSRMVSGIRFKHMTVGFEIVENGLGPRDVVRLASTAFVAHMRKITMLMVYAARSLAPTSHDDGKNHAGSLADSIVYIPKANAQGIMRYTIGVDADRWTSDYDERYLQAYKQHPTWGTLKNNRNLILYLLHEYWTIFANRIDMHSQYRDAHGGVNKMGVRPPSQRAKAKETTPLYPQVAKYITGIPVGEKFLFNGIYSVWEKESRFTKQSTLLHYSTLFPDLAGYGLSGKKELRAGKMFGTSTVFNMQTKEYDTIRHTGLAKGLAAKGLSDSILPDFDTADSISNIYGAAIPKSWYTKVPVGWTKKTKILKVPSALDRFVYHMKPRRARGEGGDFSALSRSNQALDSMNIDAEDAEGNALESTHAVDTSFMDTIQDWDFDERG